MPLVDGSGLVSPNSLRMRAHRAFGGYSRLLRVYRTVRPGWLWSLTSPLGRVTRRYVRECGLTVRRGPFAGLTYPANTVGHSGFLPSKLLGSYEAELHSFIESAIEHQPTAVLNIGSGDGFYLVGLARRLPGVPMIGYETDRRERTSALALAAANGVEIDQRGTCNPNDLLGYEGRVLIVMDVEGYERALLRDGASAFADATILVEVHSSDIASDITDTFADSHVITMLHDTPRKATDYPELAKWSAEYSAIALTEGRPRHALWMILAPLGE